MKIEILVILQSFLPKSYRPEEKSSQEQITDLLAARLGLGGSGVQDVGGGLSRQLARGQYTGSSLTNQS